MKKIVLKYGLISGVLCSSLMIGTMPFSNKIGLDFGYLVGYTTLVLSFLLVYFGIRSYRDTVGEGSITFGRAFVVGISITLITSLFYVAAWEIIYFNFMPDFLDKYDASVIAKAKAAGASAAALQAKVEELNRSKILYQNPLYNAAITFLEPFPVGLVITLISAAILRRRQQSEPSGAPLPASR
jgi:hypothetical protein